MDGIALLENIRDQHPETLVVLMSAYASVDTAIAAIKAGAHDYLTKPLSLEDLQRVADRALEVGGFRTRD
jgi:DNA-binding NtrC family response regulator